MKELLNTELLKIGNFTLSISSIVYAIFILLLARLIENIVYRFVLKNHINKNIDSGRTFALSRIIKYFIYFFALILVLKGFGFNLSAILLGSAGLLVGLGFGLQHIFADVLAGIIMLIEGNIAVGDIVVIDGIVGVVKNIKLRTTEIKTRDFVFIIVPNSKLITNNVTNWSHNESPARFSIDINVGFNEDLEKIEQLLIDCASSIPDIVISPKPQLQIIEFSDFSIKLRLFVFSDELFYNERVLSQLRRKVLLELKNNNIEIPYPIQEIRIQK
jgi:small-conductance mechanosensitive channel